MSDKMRWRYGDTNPVVAAVDADTVIEIGDLVWQDAVSGLTKPFKDFHAGQPAGPLSALVSVFLGVSMQRSRKGDTDLIRVATTGVFEFECNPGTFNLGDLIGPTGYFDNQIVAGQNEVTAAIGRIAKRYATRVPTILVDIRSTVMTGGVYARE